MTEKHFLISVLGAILVAGSVALFATSVTAATSATSCTEAGSTFLFDNVPGKRQPLPGELRRTLGALAIRAERGNCNIALTCVAADKSDASRQLAADRCVVVRDVFLRLNKRMGWTKENIDTSRKNPGSNWVANRVYLTLK
jgi:hypothetical protein